MGRGFTLDKGRVGSMIRGSMNGVRTSFRVWTEGLDEMWYQTPGHRSRMDRGMLELGDVVEIIGRLGGEEKEEGESVMILERGGRTLRVSFSGRGIDVSDPADQNYQNIKLGGGEVLDFVVKFFRLKGEVQLESSNAPRVVEWLVAAVAVVGLLFTLHFVRGYLQDTDHFLPAPVTAAIEDPVQVRDLTVRHAGVYVTKLADGELLIELQPDGQWGFYDMSRGSPGTFRLTRVEGGSFRPVYEGPLLALLTDRRYLFYPEGTRKIVFLQRNFERLGTTREDLPQLSFPEPESR